MLTLSFPLLVISFPVLPCCALLFHVRFDLKTLVGGQMRTVHALFKKQLEVRQGAGYKAVLAARC
jgi:hypothetical protein